MPEEPNDNGFQSPEKYDNDRKNGKSKSIDISICKGCKLSINKTFLPVKAALFCWFAVRKRDDENGVEVSFRAGSACTNLSSPDTRSLVLIISQ
ncbi:hypothetical protein TNIN_44271 [Trichonephila inaurata madagascariensis]|uniref:Uncharacterized protein n=1 Tax=Trichonephila inaurata madagascariensis TaxID=2747483 RepID=A0A8X6WZY4_9ARAC|nr:hypothetical protein TNIN_44271 [Trichonephila inaurata madagascariensis]